MKLPRWVWVFAFIVCWPSIALAQTPQPIVDGCIHNAQVAVAWTELREKYTKEQAASALLEGVQEGVTLASTIKAINLIWDTNKPANEISSEFYEWCVKTFTPKGPST